LIGQFATLERHLLITITAMRVLRSLPRRVSLSRE